MGFEDAGAGCTVNADCSGETPYCAAGGVCAAAPAGGALGWGDGTAQSVDFTEIHTSVRAQEAVDLEFNPGNTNELWVVHRETYTDLPCGQSTGTSGCASLQGSTTTIFNPGASDQTEEWVQDFNAWHFMRRPPAIAFGVPTTNGQYFATCGEARTGNYLDDSADFIGPTLWTSNPEIYRNWAQAEWPTGWNGTHMDMLHATPFCVGIAHEADNVYWVVNGSNGALDRYNFNEDHGPGQEDHSDGEIYRFAEGTITRVPNVPSHAVWHDGQLYVADTGGSRVISFSSVGASISGALTPRYEPLAGAVTYTGGTVTEVVPAGNMLVQPSGLEIHDGLMYVSDAMTSFIHAFDLSDGSLVRSLDTGLATGSLAGLAIGPNDGKLYFVDVPASKVVRIDPK